MSVDESVAKDLIETLEDGHNGYLRGAEKLNDAQQQQAGSLFAQLGEERRVLAEELRGMAAAYGDEITESGSLAAAAHRGWMSIKDALTSDDSDAVLKVALTGDEHAIKVFEEALTKDVSSGLRVVASRQLEQIRSGRSRVEALTT